MTTRNPAKIVLILIAIPMAMLVLPAVAAQQPTTNQAIVAVDTDAAAQAYDPMIFGGFLEHFGRQIYGGVFELGSPLADEKGFRLDVIEALKELKVPVIRWPGGCFVDSYHWQKGVGKNRQSYGDPRWGVIESNTFGTHEFIELCRRLRSEPYICHNSFSDVREMADWVAYCNATEGKFADMRKKNGHPEPFNVKFWSVGNERYDKAYIHRVRDGAKAMKQIDPSVLVTCAGSQGFERSKGKAACTVKMGYMSLDGEYEATVLTSKSADSYNDIQHPNRVAPKRIKLMFKRGVANLSPHSLTVVYVSTMENR